MSAAVRIDGSYAPGGVRMAVGGDGGGDGGGGVDGDGDGDGGGDVDSDDDSDVVGAAGVRPG